MRMVISDLVQSLQKLQETYGGDLEVWVSDDGKEKPVEQIMSGMYENKRIVMILPAFDHIYCLFGMTFYANELEMWKHQNYPDAYE